MTRLRYERRRLRQSQQHLAARVGLTQPALSQIERSILVPTSRQLERLAAALAVPQEELLKEIIIVTAAL